MSLSKEHPPKIGIMQITGNAVKEKPFRIRNKSVYGMKDSQETMTKVIDRLLGPKDPTLRLACDIHAAA